MDDNLFTPSDFFHRGMEFLDQGQFNQALEHFQQAVDRDYVDTDILGPMGEALFELGRVNEALGFFNRAVKASPDDGDKALLWKGICYLELQKHRRALSAFNRLIEKDPNNAQAHFKRGLALIETGSPKRALEALETAQGLLQNIPDEFQEDALSDVLLWKGRAKLALGLRPEALALFQEALDLVPEHPGAYTELAQYFRTLGDMKTAEEWYRKGLDRLPNDPNLHNDFGNMLRDTADYQSSLEHLTAAIDNDATRSVVYYNRALTLRALGRYDEALKDFDVVMESNPGDVDARLSKLDLLGKLNLFTDAEELIAELDKESIPRDMFNEYLAEYYSYKAKWSEARGETDAMLDAYQRVLEIHPDFLDVESPGKDGTSTEERLERLCALLAVVGDDHKYKGLAALLEGACYYTRARIAAARNDESDFNVVARNALNEALVRETFPSAANKLLAELLYYEFDDIEGALKHAEAALKEIPDYINALWVKAMALSDGKNRPDLAVECYKKMLDIAPHNVSVMFSLAELYFDHGQPQRALHYYNKAVSERPADPSIQRDIGYCYLALERYGDAIAVFSRLIEADDTRLDIRLDLAEAYLAVGDRAECETLLADIESMNEGVDDRLEFRAHELRAALCNRRKNPEGAIRLLSEVNIDDISPYGVLECCKALIKLKEYDKAEKFLDAVIQDSDPRYPMAVEARYQLARVYFANEDLEKCLSVLDELMEAAPLDERAYRLKAWGLMLQGELEDSEECAEAGKFAQEISKIVRLLQYEDYREALANAEALIETSPTRVECRYYKACAQTQLGQTDEALETVREMLKLAPDVLPRLHEEFFLEPLRLSDRIEFRVGDEEAE
ncbi:MAG: tetratricopeptide repeat protein [Planctomycetota bacterium]|jgi:tetratricopeptide (TPR) repeat protein